MSKQNTPLFPLHTPLLPGCALPLQIFEPRYLDMVSQCMRSGSGFVVVLLSEGREVQEPSSQRKAGAVPFFGTGTLATISDFGQMKNGLLAITALGQERVKISDAEQLKSGLWCGDIEVLEQRGAPSEEDLEALCDLLGKLLAHELMANIRDMVEFSSAELVMNYLIMLMPMPKQQKQALLETDHLGLRWDGLRDCISLLEQKVNG
ncbi:LON peptidase substrate-binding domain-containing protein [Gynuella sunshinyii]|nr:LON peptidase substrate-binding domain-containing protein [Gynuella sunshinyii]